MTGLGAAWRELPSRDRALLMVAMGIGAAVVIAYALITRPNSLAGDQAEYHTQGVFFDQGKLWWSTVILGEPHATAWKAPLYPAWVGTIYAALGPGPTKVAVVQGLLLAPLTVLLTWALARRWFDSRVATAAAFVIALFPLSWEFFGLLYSEALAIPMTLGVLLIALDRPRPSTARAAAAGALIGACMLVRPTSFFLVAVVGAAWFVASGRRRGLALTAVSAACAILVVAPWTIRNAVVLDGFVPISIQDAAAYGTFNEEAANDPLYPYAWRALPGGLDRKLTEDPPASEVEFRSRLQGRARDYVLDHPASVPQAFFWNGLSRFWDVRRPSRALNETDFDGRSRAVTTAGLAAYYMLLPLALVGLWRVRRRPDLFWPLVTLVAAISVVFTIQAGTRYRAPIEPIVVIMACSSVAALRPSANSERGRPGGAQVTGR